MSDSSVRSNDLIRGPVWHEDGDIVLEIVEGEIQHRYRVHRLLLSISSSVFRDMLEMPQRGADSKKVDGCPVVSLDDSPGDLTALLKALYNGLGMHHNNQLNLDVVLGILLLSDKYVMEDLRRGVLRILLEHWPVNFADYINHQKLFGSGLRVAQSMRLIRAAQHCGASELLPTAFYELANSHIQDWSELEEVSPSHNLSPADLTRLLVGRERSAQRLRKLMVWKDNSRDVPTLWNPNTSPDGTILATSANIFNRRFECSGSSAFKSNSYDGKGRAIGYCNTLFPFLKEKYAEHSLAVLKVLGETQYADLHSSGACGSCVAWFVDVLANKEREMWENLPIDFDLPNVDPKLYSESMFKSF